jgi:hypothetical protein
LRARSDSRRGSRRCVMSSMCQCAELSDRCGVVVRQWRGGGGCVSVVWWSCACVRCMQSGENSFAPTRQFNSLTHPPLTHHPDASTSLRSSTTSSSQPTFWMDDRKGHRVMSGTIAWGGCFSDTPISVEINPGLDPTLGLLIIVGVIEIESATHDYCSGGAGAGGGN